MTSLLNLSVFLLIGIPLLSGIICFLIKDRFAWVAPLIGTIFSLITCVLACVMGAQHVSGMASSGSLDWFTLGDHTIQISYLINRHTASMLMVTSCVSLLVHIYSIGYMAEDKSLPRYFGMLGFFTFAMLGLIVSSNLLLIFFFWELIGFSSYRLIGHWNEKPLAAKASTKAFVMNRLGDLGFLIALMILWSGSASLDIHTLDFTTHTTPTLTAAGICFFLGVMGKSAQFPLFNWLPDAMEGPTPVSALIHAATLVAAGVYLLIRLSFLFTADALIVVSIVGATTALLGGFGALFQFDIKKILACSTISQLGLMIMAIGSGAAEGGFLHLLHHAFFKAGLFLAAGSIIHALHQAHHHAAFASDVQDIRNLGGLRKKLPITFWCTVICGAALAGLPLTSGFMSKEIILTQMTDWATPSFSWKWLIMATAWLVTFLTPLYLLRFIWFIFFAPAKTESEITEAPVVMRIPLLILSVLSLTLLISWDPFSLSSLISYGSIPVQSSLSVTILSLILISGAILVGIRIYRKRHLTHIPRIISSQFYLDSLTQHISKLTLAFSGITSHIDIRWLDRMIHALVYVQVTFAHVVGWTDRVIVDGFIQGTAYSVKGLGHVTRSWANGKIQTYFLWALAGLLIFILCILY